MPRGPERIGNILPQLMARCGYARVQSAREYDAAWGQAAGPSPGRLLDEILASKPHPELGYRSVAITIDHNALPPYGKHASQRITRSALGLLMPRYLGQNSAQFGASFK